MRSILSLVVLALVASGLAAQRPSSRSATARTSADGFIELPGVRELTGRLIVRPVQRRAWMRAGRTLHEANARVQQARARLGEHVVLRHVAETDDYVIRVAPGSEVGVASSLTATGVFEYVEPDWRLYPIGPAPQSETLQPHPPVSLRSVQGLPPNCPDDPLFGMQWHHATTQACEAWALETGDPSISVGICDTGIRVTHEDLLLHRLEAYNAVDMLWESEGGSIQPIHPHGTRTTGTAVANGDNGVGVAGAAWRLSHRMIRVSNSTDGGAFLTDLQHGARTSIEAGDRVANVSYHGASSPSNLSTAAYIKSLGGLLLWGAGNTSSNYGSPPRDDDDLLVIGASDQGDGLAYFSSYGNFVDLFAPGVSILTCNSTSDSAYTSPDGTSYACPLASSLCALIWTRRPALSPTDVQNILKQSCDDIGPPGVDSTFGYGRINMRRALALSGEQVPEADLSGVPTSGKLPLTVQFRDQSVGVATSWSWDFGDGTTSALRNPSHTYTTEGAYTVSLSVANALGTDTVIMTDLVLADVIPPVAAFDATPVAGLAPLAVTLTDQSGGGTATSWLWDFGDGSTSTQEHPTHTYTTTGFYTVSLTVANSYGSDTSSKTDLIAVDLIPPVADFSGTPLTGASPLVVDFSDLSSAGGTPTAWSWSFGDGSTSSAQNPSHTYTAAGTYNVSLTVSNPYGSDQRVEAGYVVVSPGQPILADFVGTPTTGVAPFQVQFTDLSIGYPVEWEWDFGDNGTSNAPNPTHIYTVPGTYNVNLSVATVDGKDDSLEIEDYITVQ